MDLPAITSKSTWVTQLLLTFDSLVRIYVSLSQLRMWLNYSLCPFKNPSTIPIISFTYNLQIDTVRKLSHFLHITSSLFFITYFSAYVTIFLVKSKMFTGICITAKSQVYSYLASNHSHFHSSRTWSSFNWSA